MPTCALYARVSSDQQAEKDLSSAMCQPYFIAQFHHSIILPLGGLDKKLVRMYNV